MYFVYVLINTSTRKHYTGFTSDLTQRVGQHNSGITKSTKNRGIWELLYSERFATRSEAMRRERFLKTGQGREELKRILDASLPEAQLDRVRLRRKPEGREFDSLRARHFPPI